jgi:hypothetical protein|tara:strand:+ start:426 stop:770 length:345 start_codon:yes stop_codon:yes gene_type:complete
MTQISMPLHDANVQFCVNKIEDLYTEFEPARANSIINSTLDKFAIRLPVLECAFKQNDRPVLGKAVTALMTFANQIGIDVLTLPAENLHALTLCSDDLALAVAPAKLVRLEDCS